MKRIDILGNLKIMVFIINLEESWKKEFEKILKIWKFLKNASVFPSSIVYLIEGEGESYEN